jgi:hypothetical protein
VATVKTGHRSSRNGPLLLGPMHGGVRLTELSSIVLVIVVTQGKLKLHNKRYGAKHRDRG